MPSEQKVNVLLVDDHPENLVALEALLDSLGQNLVKANSGKEALKCLLNQDFAVILLDVQMPDMDGFETANLIRQRERSRDTPIIFLTAFSTSDTLVFKGYSLGAVDYLLKPIVPEILKSKVTVFVDLFKKTAEVKRQAAQLAAVNTELKTSEERFRCLSACSPVGIFLTDIEGRCTYANPRYQAICGGDFGLAETVENPETSAAHVQPNNLGFQQGWLQSVHPEDHDSVFADWSARMQQGQQYSREFRLLVRTTPAGNHLKQPATSALNLPLQAVTVRWVHIRSSPMLSDRGELIGHVGTVEDITDRKLAEEERSRLIREQVARQEAEAANRMKDEFLAVLSHELRTPLNSMLGWTRLLRTRKFDEVTTARALETIERNASMQAQLIEDILDVSRIIRGKLHLNLRPLNLIPVIQSAVDTLLPAAEAKEIALETVLDPAVDLVCGDLERLQQIVWNLLSNAIKFTPEGGNVQVRLSVVSSELAECDREQQTANAYAQIQVSDTGIGISSDFLPYVFDRFRQADSTTTRCYGGLGLGLAIVHHLVELHGGTVHAASNGVEQGATFTVKLLLLKNTEEKQEASPAQPLTASLLTGLQILVVDDDTDTRHFLTEVLEQPGAKVIAVASASEALSVLEQSKPDVLVSDLGMPKEDGYTLIRSVRNLDPERGGQIPAAALTAHVREEDCTQALSAGFQMYVSKPIAPDELIAVVAKLTGREGSGDRGTGGQGDKRTRGQGGQEGC